MDSGAARSRAAADVTDADTRGRLKNDADKWGQLVSNSGCGRGMARVRCWAAAEKRRPRGRSWAGAWANRPKREGD